MFSQLFLLTVVVLFVRRYREILRKDSLTKNIPGPPRLPIVGNTFLLPRSGPDELQFAAQLFGKYGRTVKLWLGGSLIVFLHDPHDLEVILKSSKELRKSSVYKFLYKWLGTGLLTSTGEKWLSRRRAITPTFHFNILEQFTDIFNKRSDQLIMELKKFESPVELETEEFLSRYTLNVVCETAMGFELGTINSSCSLYIKSIRNLCEIIGRRYLKPYFLFEPIWAVFGERSEEINTLKIINCLTEKIIREREREILSENDCLESKSANRVKPALLEKLIRQKLSGNPSLKTYDDISEEVNTFLFEGHDTTTSAMSFALDMLARHPDVQEKVYNEISEVVDDKTHWTIHDLNKLTYLEQVIKETLRLYPSVNMIARKLYNDVKLPSGYVLPSDCTVAINLYSYHRNEDHFNNPEEFNPDNFHPQMTAHRHPFAFIPFSAGPRNCIGQKFAMLGIKTAVGKIVSNFELSVAHQKPIVPYASLILRSHGGHKVIFKGRK